VDIARSSLKDEQEGSMAKDKPTKPAPGAVPGKAEEALLAPQFPAWEVCEPPRLGLLRATITKLEQADDARLACILELLLDCLRDGCISAERRTALIASVRTLKGADEESVALLIQLLSLPAESEDHSRVLVLRNYLEHAQRAFVSFKDKCRDCEASWLQAYLWKDLMATNDAVCERIDAALVKARELSALEVSCDCAAEIGKCLDALKDEFRHVERGCCVLLCEFNRGQIFEDACYVVLETRFFEGVRYIASASLTLKNIVGVPMSIKPELEPLQEMVARLLEKPRLSDQTLADLGKLQSDLALFASYENIQGKRALALRMMETAERMSCCQDLERDVSRIVGALFALQCRANQDAANQRREHHTGFHLHCPPEVQKVVVTNSVTGETQEFAPANGFAYVPYAAGQSALLTAVASDGSVYDSTTLVAS
jgi:hypothetical protein